MIGTAAGHQIANRVWAAKNGHTRQVIGWDLTGSHYRNGQRFSGFGRLYLEGGGWIYLPESESLAAGIERAALWGYDTTAIRAQVTRWVETGK